jgi:hypothetical protein
MTLHSGPYGFVLSFALEPGFSLRVVLDADFVLDFALDFALDFVLSFALFDLDV